MTNPRYYTQLYCLRHCVNINKYINVPRCLFSERSTPRILSSPTNFFWSKKKKDCEELKNESSCCCYEETYDPQEARHEYCDKTKDAKQNMNQRLKCAKQEYIQKRKQLKEDYKTQTIEAKQDYKCQTHYAKEGFRDETHSAQEDYCDKTKPPEPYCCYYEEPKQPVCCCCEEPKEPVCSCEPAKDECEEPKKVEKPKKEAKKGCCEEPKKKKMVEDPCKPPKEEEKDECEEPKKTEKPKKKKECKKAKKDECEEPKKEEKDECEESKKTKNENEQSDETKKAKKGDSEEPKKSKEDGDSKKAKKEPKEEKKKKSQEKEKCDVCPTERKDLSSDSVITSKLTGMEMPVLVLGTYKLRDVVEAQNVLKSAFTIGYRAIDTAISYGNDDIIGCALSKALEEAELEREDIFIINKLPYDAMRCEVVCQTFEKSLQKMKTPYIDLFMINFPAGVIKENGEDPRPDNKLDLHCVWKCMESLVDNGKAKYLGVANFSCDQLESLTERSKIKPSNVMVELHAYFQQKAFRKVAKELCIPVTAYAPLGRSPALMNLLKEACVEGLDDSPNVLDDPSIAAIGQKNCKTPGQVLLRYLLQMDDQLAVTIGATNNKTIIDNFSIFDFCLDEMDMALLKRLDQGKSGRLFNKEVFKAVFPGVENSPMFPWKN